MSQYTVVIQQNVVNVKATPLQTTVKPVVQNTTIKTNNTTGPAGPPGPSGAGTVVTVTTSQAIPVGQNTTIANPTADIQLDLPLISDALVSSMAAPYSVKNISSHNIKIQAAGSDQVEFDTFLDLKYYDNAVTLIPTDQGWLVI